MFVCGHCGNDIGIEEDNGICKACGHRHRQLPNPFDEAHEWATSHLHGQDVISEVPPAATPTT